MECVIRGSVDPDVPETNASHVYNTIVEKLIDLSYLIPGTSASSGKCMGRLIVFGSL